MEDQPWASGPGEILRHGLTLLADDSDINRRLAMISIDNAVELMIKTYLGLPERVTGIKISRKELSKLSSSFPSLLNGLEKYAIAKLIGVNLAEIEWYHRLRNELYHQGNGLTVERDKVEIYSELAQVLFKNLFGFDIVVEADGDKLLSDFLKTWSALLKLMPPNGLDILVQDLVQERVIATATGEKIKKLFQIRDDIIFGRQNYKSVLTVKIVEEVKKITESLQQRQEKILQVLETNADLAQQHTVARAELERLQAVQPSLRERMDRLKKRIDDLGKGTGSFCPLCGQSLTDEHRKTVLDELRVEGRELADRFRSNKVKIETLAIKIEYFEEVS